MTDRRKLTDAFAKKHFEAGNPRVIWDTIRSGFGLKENAKGHVIWIVKFRIGTGRSARTHQHKIGNPHLYSCVEARALADDFIVAGRRGEDYRETIKAKHAEQVANAHTRVLKSYGIPDSEDSSLLTNAWGNALLLNTNVSRRHARARERMWKHISGRYGDFIKTEELDSAKNWAPIGGQDCVPIDRRDNIKCDGAAVGGPVTHVPWTKPLRGIGAFG